MLTLRELAGLASELGELASELREWKKWRLRAKLEIVAVTSWTLLAVALTEGWL